MTGKEAIEISKRSRSWLLRHDCIWCGQNLWRALLYGCGAFYDRCEPIKKDFSESGRYSPKEG